MSKRGDYKIIDNNFIYLLILSNIYTNLYLTNIV